MNQYFNNNGGVYYDRFNDEILLLKEIEPYLIYNKRTNKVKIVKRYNLVFEDKEINKTAIKATKHLIILGEL